ncbi:hypothetical protein N0V82_007614 [Gnomoniopsis sp. IMI 355080]|nr:hypothetical protein N0V82_007614 [Gnomoniopsis sp. IMI 355080]
MEQPFSTSKVTVEYFDPHDVYKLLEPGLIPRLPLRNLNWQSHAGPLRSIETLHVELVDALAAAKAPRRQPSVSPLPSAAVDDGFTTQSLGGGLRAKFEDDAFPTKPYSPGYGSSAAAATRRHQIPGLRRTPYLKVLFVRCDDNDSYKSSVRAEVREWVKENITQSPSTSSGKKDSRNAAENHDAFEWLIVHVVVPNTVAATQPRTSAGKDGSSEAASTKSTTSRWGKGSSTILEKLRADFNSSSKTNADHISQIRIGINDVPYDLLPRVVPAVPTGYTETEEDAKVAWAELIDKIKRLILSSFDLRVTQYEEDIKERDAMRNLPGWNFCTFFILKEGLARGFESVGLVEDSLVGYDELSFGLDAIIQEQAAAGSSEVPGGSLLAYTDDLKRIAQKAMAAASTGSMEFEDEESVDLQSRDANPAASFDDIPISVYKKPYRELILANNVSIFDFRCYIFARQISLLLRQGNAMSTREELVTKLKEQQESVLKGVAPRALPPKQTDESENLSMLAEICKRTLEFIPAVSQVMRRDVISALTDQKKQEASDEKPVASSGYDSLVTEVAENIVASFAFSIAQQILAQTSTESLPIPPATSGPTPGDSSEPKASVPEPKTASHPARSSSLRVSTAGSRLSSLPSPNVFSNPGNRRASVPDVQDAVDKQSRKTGMEELASRRAELYALSRNILEEAGRKRGWSNGWPSAPVIGETGIQQMEEVSLDDDAPNTAETTNADSQLKDSKSAQFTLAGLDSSLLRTALDNKDDFYRLYEMLTDKALRHYALANHTHSVLANMSDLAVMKYYLEDYAGAASYFLRTTPFYGESGWSLLELSMLVMYSKCLREMKRNDEYVRVVLKLLSKAATAERERIQSKGTFKLGYDDPKDHPDLDLFKGFLADFLDAAESFGKELKHSLQNFFTNIELEGTPVYDNGQDSFGLTLKLRSVLADPLPVDKAMLRLVTAGGARELWLENTESLSLKSGRNKLHLRCNSMSPGTYEVDRIQLHCRSLKLNFERQAFQPIDRHAVNLRNPHVVLFQRTDALNLKVEPATIVQLDRDNAMDLELSTGWNDVSKCDVRVRPATGGLRLLAAEARIVGEGDQPQPYTPEAGLFSFSDLDAESSVRLRIPFTTEQDVASVSVKVEVKYTTESGTFTLTQTPSISLALKLGVNVQDVFKHSALYSRFTVSTSTSSPLRLFKSELADSDVFETKYGVPPGNPVIIFPKQPASLLYQIKRKAGIKISPKTNKIMYLKLSYSVLLDEITANIQDSMSASLTDTPLWPYSRVAIHAVLQHVRQDLTAYDLERAAILGELPTGFLAVTKWQQQFFGLGTTSDGQDAAASLTDFIVDWTRKNPIVSAMRSVESAQHQTILIPVDIPSMAVVHTADIQLQRPIPSLVQPADDSESPVACVNQLLPATLHLKWTRIWDTDRIDGASIKDETAGDEFSYEVSAPGDSWLVGGRKKGHFVIPAADPASQGDENLSSSPINEADIPLVMIPLREGFLPYPSVEVREIPRGGSDAGGGGDGHEGGSSSLVGHCETDYRNLGETVRVVADRGRVTVSLDASGPGGGPLVLESERVLVGEAARVARVVA